MISMSNLPPPAERSACSLASSVNRQNLRTLSDVCLGLGFASILISIFTWFFRSKQDPGHGERFGIFIGLWVPSFFMLSHRLARKADEIAE